MLTSFLIHCWSLFPFFTSDVVAEYFCLGASNEKNQLVVEISQTTIFYQREYWSCQCFLSYSLSLKISELNPLAIVVINKQTQANLNATVYFSIETMFTHQLILNHVKVAEVVCAILYVAGE